MKASNPYIKGRRTYIRWWDNPHNFLCGRIPSYGVKPIKVLFMAEEYRRGLTNGGTKHLPSY